jgi:hypothetical protein
MARYSKYGPLDDRVIAEGDHGFRAIDSYLESTTLKGGFVEDSQNFRLDGDTATVRKGVDFLAGTVTLTYVKDDEQVFASGVYSDPDDDSKEWLVAATKQKAIIWSKDNANGLNVAYYSAAAAASAVDTAAETITLASHKFQTGDTVQVSTSGGLPSGLSASTTYYVIDASSNTIKLATTLANANAGTAINLASQGTGNHTVQEVLLAAQNPMVVQAFSKVYIMRLNSRPLEWDGVTAASGSDVTSKFEPLSSSASGSGDPFPSTDFALYFRNRLIGSQPPTVATPTGGKTGSTIVVMSDLLSINNVTAADSEFYLNLGGADEFISAIPYMEDQLIVLNRHSIHLINNVATTSAANTYEITRQYGCVARKSIAASGPQIYFLSDSGVMVMQQGLDPAKGLGVAISKVSGEAIPLSQQIQDQFADVNFAAADKAVGITFGNKYFLAVPTGSSTVANKIFVYDTLNSGWISVDTYPDMFDNYDFHVADWAVLDYGTNPTKRRLFACNPTGWYLCEQNATDDSNRKIGSSSESNTTAIAAKLKTRSYTFEDMSVKSWHRGQLGVDVTNGDAFTVKLNTTDPNSTTTVHTESTSSTEDKIIRFGLSRARGYSANLEIDVTAGRPTIRHCLVEASGVGMNIVREIA